MPRQVSHIALRGGLDLVSSPLFIEPGRMWRSLNYDPVEGGYQRTGGYERFDGRPRPSEAKYWILAFDGTVAVAPADGATITGGTSGATAVVLKTVESEYVLGEVDGTFEDDETLMTGMPAMAAGDANGTPLLFAGDTVDIDLEYRDLAATRRRAVIAKVPGTGQVRGVWHYKNVVYAVRDDDTNDPPTAARMYKETDMGWSLVPLGHRISFDSGGNEPETGETLTGATSGATARLGAVVLTSGAWADNDAAGTFWLTNVMGIFQDDENLQQSISGVDTTVAVANGAASENTLPAGGRYEFINENFYGQVDAEEMYGVNGVGQAFHFDGTQIVFISTGQPDDKPTHIAVHRNHLLLAYRGGSLVVSETGNPDGYSALAGAAEIACGQELFGLVYVGAGNTLIVGSDRMSVLYGSDSNDFQLADHSHPQTGGVEWTAQSVGAPLYMDNRGVRRFDATDAYGNFVINTMTADIQPFLDKQRELGSKAVGSMRVRSRDQYRVWFESGIGVCIYLGRGTPEISFLDFGMDENDVLIVPRCSVSAEDANRVERIYFGADNGFVYEMNRGRSFDGREISAYVRLPLNHMGMPTQQKRFFRSDIHLDLASQIHLSIAALFNDGSNPDALAESAEVAGGGGLWDEAFWDDFYFDSPLNGYHTFDMPGLGRNASVLIQSVTKSEAIHTLNGLSVHWAPRKADR